MIKYINKILISACINKPILVLFISLSMTALITSGIGYVQQDDNMINLLPEEIGSRTIFQEIQDEYGKTEYMYLAIGNKNKNIFNKADLNIIADLSNEFESLEIVDEVISITTLDKVFSEDNFIEIDALFELPIHDNQIDQAIKYLNDNQTIKTRVVSKTNDYANIIIIPKI